METEKRIYNWNIYSVKGLVLAKKECDKKGLDYDKIFSEAANKVLREVKKSVYSLGIPKWRRVASQRKL